MKIYTEKSLRDFEFWSGAKTTAETIWDKFGAKGFDTIESELEAMYPEGMDETQINDIFWFEEDYIATLLGYRNWEHLERADTPITIHCYDIEWDVDEDGEANNLPTEAEFTIDDEDDIGDYLEDASEFISHYLNDNFYEIDIISFNYEEKKDGE